MPLHTLQYVYSASDFTVAPPGESGADAAGTPPFTVTVDPGATSQAIVVNDTNTTRPDFDEVQNSGQTLNATVVIGGTTFTAGTPIYVNYVITTASGLRLYSISITNVANSGNNVTSAWVTDDPLIPGQTYTFTTEANIGNSSVPYALLACFVEGSRVETPDGPRAVETLEVGDLVLTADHGAQPVRWIGSTEVDGRSEQLAPIRFAPGAIGNRIALSLSPQHRVLCSGPEVELLFGVPEVLVPAKALVDGRKIATDPRAQVTYWHVMFDRHEVLISDGARTESYFAGAVADNFAARAARDELAGLFPALRASMQPARPVLSVREARLLAYQDG